MASPIKVCIFCQEPKQLTAEHIFGRWFKKSQPSGFNKTKHITSFRDDTGVKSMAKGRLNRPGSPHSHQLRLICEKCNNEWLSDVQQRAKPIILDLSNGIWPNPLTDSQVLAAANWAVAVSMEIEFDDPKLVVSTADERLLFMQCLQPASNWRVYFGLFDDGRPDPGAKWHRAAKLGFSGEVHPASLNCQTTTALLGRAFFHTVSGAPQFLPDAAQYAIELGIRQFWPSPASTPSPTPQFKKPGLARVATAFFARHGVPAEPFTGDLLEPNFGTFF